MKRRAFLGASAVAAAGSVVHGLPHPESLTSAVKQGAGRPVPDSGAGLAGKTIAKLRDEYRSYLFDDFLPFMEKYVIDADYGGFLSHTDRDGTRLGTTKTPTNEGRGIWVWSYLYNELGRDQRHLDVAKRSLDLILKSQPDGDSLWPKTLTREGRPAADADTTVFGDLYIAAGIAELAAAARDAGIWKLAKDIMDKCLRVYDREDYDSIGGADPVTGPRRQNVSMLLLPTTTSLLKFKPDPEVEAVAARCVDAVVNRHFNPAYQLNNDILNHDYSRPENAHAQYVGFGISNQTLWMVLHEGVRRRDRGLYATAVARILRHVEVGWDDVYGGVFSALTQVDENTWNMSKPLHNQVESLVGLLSIIEHSGEPRARELFSRVYSFTVDKYVLKKYGFPLWQGDGDRRVTYQPHTQRAEHFHNSRHLMMNLAALDRIIARRGKTSGVFREEPANALS